MAHKHHGFTLLEILIALFIFTIVALIMTKSLHTVLSAQAATEKAAEELTQMQMALLLLSRDVEQAVDRPVLDQAGRITGSFLGYRSAFVFTHGGFANPTGSLVNSTLQRSGYRLEKSQLIRDTWVALDQAPHASPHSRVLFSSIKTLSFRYLDNKNVFHPFWPPESENYPTAPPPPDSSFVKAWEALKSSTTKLPRAVEITLTLNHGGQVQQLYLLPQQEVPHESH